MIGCTHLWAITGECCEFQVIDVLMLTLGRGTDSANV